MGVSFLTPVAALFGVLAAVPLAVFAGRRRRAAQVRSALRLEPLPRRPWGLLAACLAAVPILVGVAAAQPVVTSARTVRPGEVTYPHSGGVRCGVNVATTGIHSLRIRTASKNPASSGYLGYLTWIRLVRE